MTPTALPHIESGKMVALGVTTQSQGSTPQALTQRIRDEVRRVQGIAPAQMKGSS